MNVSDVLLLIRGDASGAITAIKETGSQLGKVKDTADKAHSSFLSGVAKWGIIAGGAAALGGVTAAIGSGVDAFKNWQSAQAGLQQALKDTGQSIPQDQLDAHLSQMRSLGHTDTETAQTIQSLVLAGVPAGQALGDLGTVADLAAAKHMSLADATDAIAKAANGRMSPALKELGVHLKKGESGTAALNDILGQLGPKIGGQAAAQSETFNGALQKMGAAWDHVAVSLGEKVAPFLTTVADWIANHSGQIADFASGALGAVASAADAVGKGIGFVKDHFDVIAPILGTIISLWVLFKAAMLIGALIEGVGTALSVLALVMDGEITPAMAAAAFGAEGLGVAIDFMTGPIGLIILAIAALIGVVILIATHFTQTKQIVGAVLSAIGNAIGGFVNGVKSAIGAILSWLGQNWPLLLTIIGGPIGAAVAFVITHFNQIKDFIGGVVNDILGVIAGLGTGISNAWNGILTATGRIWSAIVDVVKGFVNAIIGFVNTIIDAVDSIQFHVHAGPINYDFNGVNLGKIPKLATGATLNQATLAVLGEAGREHAVPDLAMSELMQRAAESGAAAASIGTVVVNNPRTPFDVTADIDAANWRARMARAGIGRPGAYPSALSGAA